MPAAQPQLDDATLEAALRQVQQQPEQPPAQAQAPPSISPEDETWQAAVKQAYEESKSPAEKILDISQIPADIVQREAANILGIPAAISRVGAQVVGTQEAPNLQGLSVDQVKAVRGQMQEQLGQQNKVVDDLMKSGAPDDTQLWNYNARVNSLQERIKQADQIIASGKPAAAPSPMVSPAGWLLREFGRRYSTAEISNTLNQVFPTNQDFANSPLGQVANFGADGLTMAGLQALFGPFATTAYASSQMADQVYDAKKQAGASDEEAERASALTSLVTIPTMAVAGPTVDFLAKSFAGMTAKQGIQALIRTGIHTVGTGAEFGGLNWEQEAIGQLQGYDPNHPLDQHFWQNFLMGNVFGFMHGITSQDPRLARENKPDVKTRNREEAPAPPTPEAPAPGVPEVETPAAAAIRAARGEPVAPRADSEQAWNRFADEATREGVFQPGERGFVLGPGAAPTVPERPAPEAAATLALGAPSTETLERQGETAAVAETRAEAAAPAPRAAVPEEPRPWYEEPAAARVPVPRAEAVDRPVTIDDVKREVQDAQAQMGMHDNLIYVPNADALPSHVRNGLDPAELSTTAQIVTDRKLGNTYVIGDRFSSLNELRRAIIEEALPYRYRNVTELGVKHDPTDRNFGTYDHIADNPELNTHALLLADRPYEEAAKSAMEEVNVHQGISRLLGSRYGRNYVNGMRDVFNQFQSKGWLDMLAQKKGYTGVDDMAKPENYNVPDWRTDPRQRNKLTEELIGAYSRTFPTPEALEANGPNWYQRALRGIQNGIRSFLGLEVTPYDVQSLLADSAAALRRAKYGEQTQYQPAIGEAAKQDMEAFRYANRPPAEEGGPSGETAQVGEEMLGARRAEIQRGLRPGQAISEQPWKLSFDTSKDFSERMSLLSAQTVLHDIEGDRAQMQAARSMYDNDFGGNPNVAMNRILDWQQSGRWVHPGLIEVTNRASSDLVRQLRDSGFPDQAALLEAKRDRFNLQASVQSTQSGQRLQQEKVRYQDGARAAADHRAAVQETQAREIIRPSQQQALGAVNDGFEAVNQVAKDAATELRGKADAGAKKIASRWGTTMTLPEQYTRDLVQQINDAMFKTNTGFGEDDRPILQQVYDTFRSNIQQIIKERAPPTEPAEKPPRPAATDTLRTIVDNYPQYKEAWAQTMDMLHTQNPELAQRFARAIEEPIGETLANKLATEQGQNLSDLIFKHYSTTDRINTDLATKITNETGIRGDLANNMALHLQNMFDDIVRTKQADKLQSILKAVGGDRAPAKDELNRLVDHIVIGGLDSPEWLNLVAPRFGIENYSARDIQELKIAGDEFAKLRDIGLSSTLPGQQIRARIAELTRLAEPSWISSTWRYLNDIYTSALLTGPFTHLPYWMQNWVQGLIDSTVQGVRASVRTGDPSALIRMGPAYAQGLVRGTKEWLPIVRGIPAAESFLREEDRPFPSRELEKGPITADPRTWLNTYKYVRNILSATSNLLLRGPEYATMYANALSTAWDHGLRGQDAWTRAEQVVRGTSEQQAAAQRDASRLAEELKLSKDEEKMLSSELLDRYKVSGDRPDSVFNAEQADDYEDAARRAFATGLTSTLRGEVPGTWGHVSRGLLNLRERAPVLRPVLPFLKVPFNAANEFTAWSPIGLMRGLPDLVPSGPGEAAKKFGLGIENYVNGMPGMRGKIESGDISEAGLRDLAWNQTVKGVAGSAIYGTLGLLIHSLLSNKNPPVRFTYIGPDNYGQQQIERGKGWQPKSVYFGGAWHSYENSPWRGMFAALGAYEDAFRYNTKPGADPDEMGAIFSSMRGGVTSALGSPLQGLDTALSYLSQFAGGQDWKRALSDYGAQLVSSIMTVPVGGTAFRQLARTIPTPVTGPTEYQAPPNDFMGKIFRYTPVVNSLFLQPKLNVLGEHIESTPLKNFPEWPSVVPSKDADPVWNYLATHPEIKLTMPGNQGSVGHIKMSPDEIYQYQLARGPMLKQELARAFADPRFTGLPEPMQNQIVKRSFERAANRVGQMAVMKYRQTQPVTPERIRQALSARGITESTELEEQMAGAPLAQPVQHFQEGGPVTGFESSVPLASATGTATKFGYQDPQDIGVGSAALGQLSTNNDFLHGVAVPANVLRQNFGNDPAAWRRARVEITHTQTGQSMRVPIVDIGPGNRPLHRGVVTDFTEAVDRSFGNQGGPKNIYDVKLLSDAGPDVNADPAGFWTEQSRMQPAGISIAQQP